MMWFLLDDMSFSAMLLSVSVLLFIERVFENQRVIPVSVLCDIVLCVMVPEVVWVM